ncbi:hypothetical protein FACS1894124_7870 [Spirochaetia bacterium]|nr:hypothetical protein FACS1894124_7870 [Spirochaetia bacterium]
MAFRREFSLFLILFLLGSVFSLGAQTNDEVPIEPDWDGALPELYANGDKLFVISVGAVFPTIFLDNNGEKYTHNVKIGGTGSLGFNYFLGSHLYLGAEIGGMFASTLAGNMLYMVPMGLRVGYQFILKRFEFPLSLMVGFVPQTYLKQSFGGLFMKPEVSAFWRLNPDWSFGLNTGWWWVPQWPKEGHDKDRHGNFIELTLSARYHL